MCSQRLNFIYYITDLYAVNIQPASSHSKHQVASTMKSIPIITISTALILLALSACGRPHDPTENRLLRRISDNVPPTTSSDIGRRNEDEAEILLNGSRSFRVAAPPGSASQKQISLATVLLTEAEIVHGPPGFACFFHVPLRYSFHSFISPTMYVASDTSDERPETVQAEGPEQDSDRGIQDAPTISDDDNTSATDPTAGASTGSSQQLRIPPQDGPFPARTMFCYRLPDPSADTLVLLEDQDGNADLYLVKLGQVRRKGRVGIIVSPGVDGSTSDESSSGFKMTVPSTVRRAALITAPNLERTSCALDTNSFDNDVPFDAQSPLLPPMPITRVVGLLCFEK